MPDLEHSGIDSPEFQLRTGSLGLRLRFSPEPFAALTAEIGAGFMSIPRRGAEVGGILAGKIAQEGSEWVVTIDRITPVPIQYQYGPSFRLSPADEQQFQKLLKHGQSNRVIGWYRSNTRPQQEPEEADRQISGKFFGRRRESIFLFCQPSADGQINATCTVVMPGRPEAAFSFELGRFSRVSALLHSRLDDAAEAPRPISRRTVAIEPPAAPVARHPARTLRRVGVAAAALAMAGALWYARGRVFSATPASAHAPVLAAAPSPAPAASDSLLGLRADYQGRSLLIGWDRTAPEVASAASATFRIEDGGRARTLNLSARELQKGSIIYKPSADEISLELNVTSPKGATASQWLRIVGAPFQPRSSPNRITASPRRLQPPPDSTRRERHDVAIRDLPPPRPAPTLIASSLPSAAALPSGAGSETLTGFAKTRREFHPAAPVHSPQPVPPSGVRLPDRPLPIRVEVTIDPEGRVTAARLVSQSGPYTALLAPSALNTARTWRFRPATLGGQPIQSTTVLTFRYARSR